METNVEWKDVPGFEDVYEVSNQGLVVSYHRPEYKREGKIIRLIPKQIKVQVDRHGYSFVLLNRDYTQKNWLLHRLVAEVFLPNFDQSLDVNHKNGIKTDNRVDNLEMMTKSQNIRHWLHELGGIRKDGSRVKNVSKPPNPKR